MNKTTSEQNKIRSVGQLLREIVFGAEDGMVSTLGAITGIAIGSGDQYTILLSGCVIIAVESISMGIGSYLSNRSFNEVTQKVVDDEKVQLKKFPREEEKELYSMFLRDGWEKDLAFKMAQSASFNKKLMLKEHEYRELGIFPNQNQQPIQNAFFMFISYIIGGTLPIISYLFFPISTSIIFSVAITLLGLFCLGALTTLFTNAKPIKVGLRLVLMGGFSFIVGLLVGNVFSMMK